MSIATSVPIAAPVPVTGGVLPFLRRLVREKPLGAAGGAMLLFFLFCGVFADFIAPFGYNDISPPNGSSHPALATGSAPTTWAATCCRAASTARSCRSSSAAQPRCWPR
jgi:hypothetical protein